KFPIMFLMAIGAWLCTAAQSPWADVTFNDSLAHSRRQVTTTGMLVLGGWAVANIATGFVIAGNSSGERKYGWQMDAYWNFVNLGLAGMGYIRALGESRKLFSLPGNYDAQNALEKIYAFNLGLDAGYIAAGLYLRERGLNSMNIKTSAQLRGYGTSIIVQGGFLMLMDAAMYLLHHRNTVRVRVRLREYLALDQGREGRLTPP
ncbi:MAG TPA: hypothetical protein VGR89_13195, partial [Puia sp.]|nr:hypothetical protein [Puia sp.]